MKTRKELKEEIEELGDLNIELNKEFQKKLNKRNAEVKQAIRKLKVYSIKDKKGNVRDCILVEELLQKLGLGEE